MRILRLTQGCQFSLTVIPGCREAVCEERVETKGTGQCHTGFRGGVRFKIASLVGLF